MSFGNRKGVGVIAMVFVVLVVIFAGVIWYQYNILGGVGVSQETLEATKQEKTDFEFQNSILFLTEALGDSTTNASQTVSDKAGRNGSEEKYRYWRCDTGLVDNSGRNVIDQIPTVKRVRQSMRNKTTLYMQNYTKHLYGLKDNVIYQPGDIMCSEIGYKAPLKSRQNDNYRTSMTLTGLNVSFQNYKRSREDVTLTDKIAYNRFWYIYAVLGEWSWDVISGRKIQNEIKSEVSKAPDYISAKTCIEQGCICPCPLRSGCLKIPDQWITNVKRRMKKAIQKHVDNLENNKKYFGNRRVRCVYDIKQRWIENIPKPKKSCSEVDCDMDGEKETLVKCKLEYIYKMEIDVEFSCYDYKFRSIPREELERLTWTVRYNIEAVDPPNEGPFPKEMGGKYPWGPMVQSPGAEGEKEFPVCKIGEENPEICQTPAKVIGKMSEEEQEGLY